MSGRRRPCCRLVSLSGQQHYTERRAIPLQESPSFSPFHFSQHKRLSMSRKGWPATASSNTRLRMRRVKARIAQLLRRLKRSIYCRLVELGTLQQSTAGGFQNSYCSPRTSTSYPDAIADCIEFIKKSGVSSDSLTSKAK